MAGQTGQECAEIPAVIAGKDAPGTVQSCAGQFFADVYQNLGNKVAKVETFTADGRPDSGSGFFVQDGTHMVTNAHVVINSPSAQIEYNGKTYSTRLEKLDDKNDLAELKIVGLDADPSRAQKVGKVDLVSGEPIASVGVPYVDGHTKMINPGELALVNNLYNILTNPDVNDTRQSQMIEDAYHSNDPGLKADAQVVASSTRLINKQGAIGGDSGSPIVDANQNLVGVVTAITGNNVTLAVPYNKVQDLIGSPDPTFNFQYHKENSLAAPTAGAGLLDAGGLAATAAAIAGKGRLMPLAYAIARAAELPSDIKNLNASESIDKGSAVARLAEDATMAAGGLATTLMWKSSVGRVVGLGAMGLALAARTFGDSQHSTYVLDTISRKNGDQRKPWHYD